MGVCRIAWLLIPPGVYEKSVAELRGVRVEVVEVDAEDDCKFGDDA
jgi:hypothetical protein